jgi:hypothetical protein
MASEPEPGDIWILQHLSEVLAFESNKSGDVSRSYGPFLKGTFYTCPFLLVLGGVHFLSFKEYAF